MHVNTLRSYSTLGKLSYIIFLSNKARRVSQFSSRTYWVTNSDWNTCLYLVSYHNHCLSQMLILFFSAHQNQFVSSDWKRKTDFHSLNKLLYILSAGMVVTFQFNPLMHLASLMFWCDTEQKLFWYHEMFPPQSFHLVLKYLFVCIIIYCKICFISVSISSHHYNPNLISYSWISVYIQ